MSYTGRVINNWKKNIIELKNISKAYDDNTVLENLIIILEEMNF